MPLNIMADWDSPIRLVKKRNNEFGWDIESRNLDDIPRRAGVYVFARVHGDTASPIYIGKALNLRARIKSHLNSISLMTAIDEAKTGDKVIMLCLPNLRANQDPNAVITVLEDALIEHALHSGCEILNQRGTKFPAHKIDFYGNRLGGRIAPRSMKIKA